MHQSELRERLESISLYQRLVDHTLPALAGEPEGECSFELVLVGRSDVRQASYEVAVLMSQETHEVAVVWLPNSLFRRDGSDWSDPEVSVHVYPRRRVIVSTSAVLHASGDKAALILVLPDGQTQSGTREVRIATNGELSDVGRAARALRLLSA